MSGDRSGTAARRQKLSFELWLTSIIGVAAQSQKQAPTGAEAFRL